MTIVERAKNICLTPNTEWPVIAAEPASAGGLMTGYVLPLAAIGSIAGFIGGSIVGRTVPFIGGTYRVSVAAGLAGAIFTFVMAAVGVFILSIIINALAPTFGGQQDSGQALKVAAYSYTPGWLAGALHVLPGLDLLALLAAFYGLYLLFLGLPVLMKSPRDKAAGYTVVVVICAIVLSVLFAAIGSAVVGAGMMGAGALAGVGGIGGRAASGRASTVQFDKDSALGKLQDLGNKLEENNKKVEAAQKAGDQGAAATAAMSGLGILFGGGKHADAVDIAALKPLVPEKFAGLPKSGGSAERNGIAGLMVTKAEGTYSDGAARRVTLTISDTGGASGLVALAGWAAQGEREDDNGSERTAKENGRLVHERVSKNGGSNEFDVIIGERFLVGAEGHGVDLDALKAAVSTLDLAKLESMKDVGMPK